MLALVCGAPQAARGAAYSLEPELSVTETYDDNVNRSDEDPEHDFITGVHVGVSMSATSPRVDASARYGLGTEFFARETEEDGELEHAATASLLYRATRRLNVRIADTFRLADTSESEASRQVPQGDGVTPPPPSAAAPGTAPTRRVRQLANTVLVDGSYRYDAVTTIGTSYAYEAQRYDAPEFADTDTHTARILGSRQIGRDDSIGLNTSVSWARVTSPEEQDRWFADARATWGHAFSERTSLTASLGVAWSDERDVDPGVVGDLSVTHRTERGRFTVGYSGGYLVGNETGEAERSDRVGLGIAHALGSRAELELGAAAVRNESLEEPRDRTSTYSLTARLRGRITERLEWTVGYEFERNDARAVGNDFTSNRVSVGLTVRLPSLQSGHL